MNRLPPVDPKDLERALDRAEGVTVPRKIWRFFRNVLKPPALAFKKKIREVKDLISKRPGHL